MQIVRTESYLPQISLSLEQGLLILLLAYITIFLVSGVVKGRKYLKSYDNSAPEYFFHSANVILALMGLSLTALALFVGLGLNNLQRLYSIIRFFSISFVVFAISLNLSRFTRRIFTFIADIFADVGTLALACGFLVFFANELPNYPDLELIYGLFIGFFFLFSFLDLHKYYRFWSAFNKASKK